MVREYRCIAEAIRGKNVSSAATAPLTTLVVVKTLPRALFKAPLGEPRHSTTDGKGRPEEDE